ncbi:LPS export ABC transporter periplasmic protein LptC [Xinfangfangia pollutisoli]|uniref:LPS export ABC transporter periplasmic protein LptC n=1 Tax=Xinfangfangia pollutisoli TaxID=2865960 RepID=UPI001CD338FF|nr:LPS export ABC transporter periplasmic protein LptC [Xinfangfangia pollutisoli]
MPRSDTHTRIVGWLKLVLPLTALVLLSTLFLLSERIDPSAAIPYADVDVEDLARDPRMTAPAYAGTTQDGTAITVTATEARPASANRTAGAAGVKAKMTMPDGGSTEIDAAEAEIDDGSGELRMTGGVTLLSSSGYRLVTERMVAQLDRSGASSDDPVQAEGPAGTLTATGFRLTQQAGADAASGDPYLLVFTGRVKLVYQPGGAAAP